MLVDYMLLMQRRKGEVTSNVVTLKKGTFNRDNIENDHDKFNVEKGRFICKILIFFHI